MSRADWPIIDPLPTPTLYRVGEFVTVGDIAEMYGVTRQAVDAWTRAEGFPEPADQTRAGRIWRASDIVAWAESRGRHPQG